MISHCTANQNHCGLHSRTTELFIIIVSPSLGFLKYASSSSRPAIVSLHFSPTRLLSGLCASCVANLLERKLAFCVNGVLAESRLCYASNQNKVELWLGPSYASGADERQVPICPHSYFQQGDGHSDPADIPEPVSNSLLRCCFSLSDTRCHKSVEDCANRLLFTAAIVFPRYLVYPPSRVASSSRNVAEIWYLKLVHFGSLLFSSLRWLQLFPLAKNMGALTITSAICATKMIFSFAL